jgi:hypothetical protein
MTEQTDQQPGDPSPAEVAAEMEKSGLDYEMALQALRIDADLPGAIDAPDPDQEVPPDGE